MFDKVVSCSIALTLITLVYGGKHEELLDGGYEYFPGVGYYYFGTNNKSWFDAQKDCTSSKARLTVINSEEELQTILSFLSNHTHEDHVLGGFNNAYDSEYVTSEGIALRRTGYEKWEAGKPSGDPFRCGGINAKTGELTDLDCNYDTMSYVCEHQLWTGYTYVEGIGHYQFHVEPKSWTDAYDICESEGAHLLVINSEAEFDAVMLIYKDYPNLPTDYPYNIAFQGFRAVIEDLTDDPLNGTYLTIFGTSVSDLGYVKWDDLEPKPRYYQFCGALYRDSAAYIMEECANQHPFFCERELQEFKKT